MPIHNPPRLCLSLLALALLAAPGASAQEGAGGEPPRFAVTTAVVVLVDGLAGDTVERFPTPELDRLSREGAWSHEMLPAFPSVSAVNSATISTGCWPARHGIVGNRFLDPVLGLYDQSPDSGWLAGCQHLARVVEAQGGRTASFGWWGANADGGHRATDRGPRSVACAPDGSSDTARTAEVIRLLEADRRSRPSLILVYLCGPDEAQHAGGPGSEAARVAMARADAAIGRLRATIRGLPDGDRVALVVTADHGVAGVDTLVNITRILDAAGIRGRAVANGGMAHVYVEGEPDPAALRRLAAYEEFDTHLKATAPEWMRLGSGPRVGDLILVARPPRFFADVDLWPWYSRFLASVGPRFAGVGGFLEGEHGFDPRLPEMRGVLYLWGAGIPAGVMLGEARAVDVHPTVTRLLGMESGDPVDGVSLVPLRADVAERDSGDEPERSDRR